jgi:hypothetical protein
MATRTVPKLNRDDVAVIVHGEVSDLRATKSSGIADERDVTAELGRKLDTTKEIDRYEEQLGIRPRGSIKKGPKYFWKNAIFYPAKPVDRDALNELMNNPKFKILEYKGNFSHTGEYQMFVIYGERIDATTSPKPETK